MSHRRKTFGSGYVGNFTAAIGSDSTNAPNRGRQLDLHGLPIRTWHSWRRKPRRRPQTYAVTIDDRHGGTATQNVTVTLTNPDNAPAISGTQNGAVTAGLSSTVPSGELVNNGGFESSLSTGWTVTKGGSDTSCPEHDEPHSGSQFLPDRDAGR